MKHALLLSLALLALPSVASAAQAYEAPEAFCHDLAEAAYQLAVARGDGLPDITYERVQANCDYTAFRAHLFVAKDVSLDDLIAFDQDGQSFFVEAGWN